MIVLDESIYDTRLLPIYRAWYHGQIISINSLRPKTLVKDEAIPTLLLRATQPTFVTINITDFWLKASAHANYSIIAIPLHQDDSEEVSDWLRRCLKLPMFHTKARRMGKVILLRPSHIEFYAANKVVNRLNWSS